MRLYRLQTPEGYGPYWGRPCSNCDGNEHPEISRELGPCQELHKSLDYIAGEHFPATAPEGHRFWFTETFARKHANKLLDAVSHPNSRLKLYVRRTDSSRRCDACQHTHTPPHVEEESNGQELLAMFVEEA